jgi:hypothetical protein
MLAMPTKQEWYDLAFRTPVVLDDAAEAALEDYARVVARAESAEALVTGEKVSGVRLRGGEAPAASMVRDIEDFACDLATRGGGSGLGWA